MVDIGLFENLYHIYDRHVWTRFYVLFSINQIIVRELVLFERWYQEANNWTFRGVSLVGFGVFFKWFGDIYDKVWA